MTNYIPTCWKDNFYSSTQELTLYTFTGDFTVFQHASHKLLANISYIPTCWKWSFLLLNITFKILHISRTFCSFSDRSELK